MGSPLTRPMYTPSCESKWVNWIKTCITFARFSILVNGSPKGFFGASNGLRQGDPLSPLLFIVAAHILNHMLALGMQNNLIQGIQFPNSRPQVLNIQYADDTLIFLTPGEDGIINLKRILCCFQVCSGLKINFSKSSLTGIRIPNAQLDRYCAILGCWPSAIPIVHLGLLLHVKKASYSDWALMIDKITSKLDVWKTRYLSLEG